MKGKPARLIFLVVCVILAVLLLARVIAPMTSGIIFAAALAILGSLSAGFKKP